MHLKRQKAAIKLPIPRKGTKYIARALSHTGISVPVVIAVRDMLKLARTSGEVKKMINQKLLKINSRPVKDLRESIQLFNLFEAGKTYTLTLLPTGKFVFEEAKDSAIRLCKIINKTLIKKNKIQLNLHDGSNVISDEKVSIGDSLFLDSQGKIKKHLLLQKEKPILIISGKYIGLKGKILSLDGKIITLHLPNKEKPVQLNQYQIMAI